MMFFETNPYGRIMNRFGKDIDTIDTKIVENFRGLLNLSLRVVFTWIVVSYTTPLALTVVFAAAVIYLVLQVSLWYSLY